KTDIPIIHQILLGGYCTRLRSGHPATIAGLSGTWTVVDATGAVLTLKGPQLSPLPNYTAPVTAVSTYVGIVKAVTDTALTLNLALSLDDFPTGPHFPVAPGASQTIASENVTVLNRVGNSAPFFVFPLANPYQLSGNDVIDAHLLDWSDDPAALRPIGVTIYGGSGDDLIIGSQTG